MIFIGSTSKAMADREKKKGKTKIQKFKYLKNEKSFLDEIKNIFHSFWSAIIWWKINIWWIIADTSFNDSEDSLGADEEPAVILRMNFSIREVQVLCQSYGVSVDFRNIKATTSIVWKSAKANLRRDYFSILSMSLTFSPKFQKTDAKF